MKYEMMVTVATSVLVTVDAEDTWLAEGEINNNMIFDAIVASRKDNNLWFDHEVEWIVEKDETPTEEPKETFTELDKQTRQLMGFIDDIISPKKKEVL